MSTADQPVAPPPVYQPRHAPTHRWVPARRVEHHVSIWGDPSMISTQKPPLILCHGFMDVGASFQFLVDAIHDMEGSSRYILAPDWRGFGLTRAPATDCHWFPDYLGDLDALLRSPALGLRDDMQVDLLGHSMGGNVAMSYAGVQATRIRRLVNLEGFGLPRAHADEAPVRLARWLRQLADPPSLRSYPDAEAVKDRLQQANPRLPDDKARWLATQWAEPREDGQWHLRADPAHKMVNPLLYRVEEVLSCWARITAPVLWVEGAQSETSHWWAGLYPREEFEGRLAVVADLERHTLGDAGHMMHHDQPAMLARHLLTFLDLP